MNKGNEIEPKIDAREEYFDIKKTVIQIMQNTMPKIILIETSIPIYVATPFPPFNFNHRGNTCPKKTPKADINIKS